MFFVEMFLIQISLYESCSLGTTCVARRCVGRECGQPNIRDPNCFKSPETNTFHVVIVIIELKIKEMLILLFYFIVWLNVYNLYY